MVGLGYTYVGLPEIFTNIRINLISPETKHHAEHFCCRQYESTFIRFLRNCFRNPRKKVQDVPAQNRI